MSHDDILITDSRLTNINTTFDQYLKEKQKEDKNMLT